MTGQHSNATLTAVCLASSSNVIIYADCLGAGNAILKVRAADVCDDKEWQGLLESCLDCALEYDIWRYYGGELEPAAKQCGIDATPKPAGGDSDVETESVHQMPSSSAESQEEPQTELSGAATTSSATTIEVVTSAVTTIEVTSPAEAEPTPAGDHDDHHEHDEHEEHTPSVSLAQKLQLPIQSS